MFIVYIIQSNEGRYYIGSTEDLNKRLYQHNNKQFKGWTNRYTNWKVVYKEALSTRTAALKRERQIKKMKGGIQFKHLLTKEQSGSSVGS